LIAAPGERKSNRVLTEYRQHLSDFHTELAREEYLFRAGRKEQYETARIFSDYRDLFTRAAASELRAALEATAEFRETERDAIRLLIAFALDGHLQSRVRELSEAIGASEARATVKWDGQTLSFHESATVLANESGPARRRDLQARRAEVTRGAQDLRAERLERLHEAARELGYASYLALYQELRRVDYENLAARSAQFLAQTESLYVKALDPLLRRDAHIRMEEATHADLPYLRRLPRFDGFFPRERLREVYRATFAGLGVNTEQQSNIEVDDVARPRKHPRAFCAPVRVPEEIKLVISPVGGQSDYQTFLHEAGHAQHFAWTSRNLHPEFRFGGDYAVTETYAFLFSSLALDERWLAELCGFTGSAEFRHALAVHKLISVRRYAAKLNFEVELHAGKLTGTAAARYAELLTDGVRVRYDGAEHLSDLDDAFYAANYLRAWALEAQLREHLKSRYGTRWWASRKAGETLIDLWNTGNRYSAEALASLIGLGELSFDWLASELLAQVAA
jgi:hypothetical protein